ncbi:class I SAM-dependent methyltransferase [Alteribacter natronophilus]|uniref:class I SAM-dependent methyltransferase n=1 Tax=Alteribacter natronophilus TaxID=2583810 RepID=UPI00110DEA8E|nr:methyltransferase domain-containing protein [Alteribacter natronophilus]TMW70664.1 methyltransferase domain-containing protein [Alteribacter natronophilus]
MTDKRFDPAKADRLLSRERQELINPQGIVELLDLRDGDTAADIGAGNGFFTLPLAQQTSGEVYAVDIEPEMLGLLGIRLMEAGIENAGMIEAPMEDITLPDECVNGLVAGFVVHESDDRMLAFSEMKRLLKPGGTAAVSEWKKESFTMGPPEHERIESDIIRREMTEAGFHDVTVHMKDRIYTVTGKK